MGADKPLALPGRKQAKATEDLMFTYHIYNHNWRNFSTIYTYKKTSIKRKFSPSNKIHREVGRLRTYQHPGNRRNGTFVIMTMQWNVRNSSGKSQLQNQMKTMVFFSSQS
jgi:hypothetical protein